jgi:hypothetical protein
LRLPPQAEAPFPNDIPRVKLRVALQHRCAVHVAAHQGPHAVVDPQLQQSSVGRAVGEDRDRHLDWPRLTVEVEDELLEAAVLGDHVLHRVERHLVLREE